MTQSIYIDGRRGEGGGQILRSALALSAWLGVPFEMTGIRAKRPNPGLKAQHLAAVKGVAALSRASIEGASKGSQRLLFRPGAPLPGNYRWEVGTAGATTLVAQATALPLLRATGRSRLTIGGGSHVAWAPPLDYLRDVYAPLLRFLGLRIRVKLLRYGFYPRGGGRILVEIEGPPTFAARAQDHGAGSAEGGDVDRDDDSDLPIALERPPREQISIGAVAVVSSLPRSIAERMLEIVRHRLASKGWSVEEEILEAQGSQGAYVFIRVHSERVTGGELSTQPGSVPLIAGGFTGLGKRGKPAEKVAEEAVVEALSFLESDASIDSRLADQILLPAILAGRDLTFTTNRATNHLRTNAETITLFLGPCVTVEADGRVRVRPAESRSS
jgi:RNA 3'-terminal phosphate cyclase (ATP)